MTKMNIPISALHLVTGVVVCSVLWSAVFAAPPVPQVSRRLTGFACEGYMLNINCSEYGRSHKIVIHTALYGRVNLVTCTEGYDPTSWSNNCFSRNAVSIVAQRCNHKHSCDIEASNSAFNGDPCPNTYKYLEVKYFCNTDEDIATTTQYQTTTEEVSNSPPTRPVRPTRKTTPSATTQQPETTTRKKIDNIVVNFCEATINRNISWTRTRAGRATQKPCPNNPSKKATWNCSSTLPAHWVGSPDLSRCVSPWVNDIEDQLNNNASIEDVATQLEQNTASNQLYGPDLTNSASVMQRMADSAQTQNKNLPPAERKQKAKNVTKLLTKTGSNLLSPKQGASWTDLNKTEQAKTASSIFTSMEMAAFNVAEEINEPEVVLEINDNILLEVNVVKVTNDVLPVVFPEPDMLSSDKWKNMSDQIIFPSEGLKQYNVNGLSKLVIIAYNEINKYLGPQTNESEEQNGTKTVVNTRIISASINQIKESVPLRAPLIFTLQHNDTEYNVNPQCSYLDYSNSISGSWSTTGCRASQSNLTHTTCECDHLTNFAVLLDVKGTKISEDHELSLIIITYVGCIISLVCLLLSWLTFQFFRNLQSDRTTIHKNLVFCLFVAELIFLFGINQADKKVLCSVIAGFLHYFFLASFSWMCLEGIQLYVMLIEVFEAERSRVKYYYLAGYGVPALIVGLSAGISYGIGQPGYGTERHCWLETANGFIWSFVGPVAVVITINIAMLSIAIYMMCKHANTSSAIRAKDKSRTNNMKKEICGHDSKPTSSCDNSADKPKPASNNSHQTTNCTSLGISTDPEHPGTSGDDRKRSVSFKAPPSMESGDSTATDVSAKSGKSHKSNKSLVKKDDTPPSMIMAWIKGAIVLVVLLGLTWAFGLLFISSETLVMAYVFTVLNSFQGLFIFIFHCIMNDKVQKEYKKCVRRATWCPMCIRVKYGGHKGAYNVSTTPTPSSSSGNYFQRLWSGRRRKKSATGRSHVTPPKPPLMGVNVNIHMGRLSSGDSGCLSPDTAQSSQLSPMSGKTPEICYTMDNDEGIDLSCIDASVVDSEFVSEYCRNNMSVENDIKQQERNKQSMNGRVLSADMRNGRLSVASTDKGEISSDYADTEIYKMSEKEKMLLEYEMENQNCLKIPGYDSLGGHSDVTAGEFTMSEVSDDELFKMTERQKAADSHEVKPLIISESDNNLVNQIPNRVDKKQWRSRSEKTLSTIELLGSDDESECNTLKRSMPNLKVITEDSGRCDSKHERLSPQRSLPNLVEDLPPEYTYENSDTITYSHGKKLKRLSSDSRTKFNPHKYRLNSSDC